MSNVLLDRLNCDWWLVLLFVHAASSTPNLRAWPGPVKALSWAASPAAFSAFRSLLTLTWLAPAQLTFLGASYALRRLFSVRRLEVTFLARFPAESWARLARVRWVSSCFNRRASRSDELYSRRRLARLFLRLSNADFRALLAAVSSSRPLPSSTWDSLWFHRVCRHSSRRVRAARMCRWSRDRLCCVPGLLAALRVLIVQVLPCDILTPPTCHTWSHYRITSEVTCHATCPATCLEICLETDRWFLFALDWTPLASWRL